MTKKRIGDVPDQVSLTSGMYLTSGQFTSGQLLGAGASGDVWCDAEAKGFMLAPRLYLLSERDERKAMESEPPLDSFPLHLMFRDGSSSPTEAIRQVWICEGRNGWTWQLVAEPVDEVVVGTLTAKPPANGRNGALELAIAEGMGLLRHEQFAARSTKCAALKHRAARSCAMNAGLPTCRHRGARFAPNRWVCSSSRLIAAKGVTADICNEICPWVNHEPDVVTEAKTKTVHDEYYGVAIGTFDSRQQGDHRYGTEAVRLNLAVLRANCGQDVKILVCDDGSPAESQARYRQLCREYDAEFSSNSVRMGHTSGDMIVFHKAICWAREHRLQTVTKLSHRMIIDVENWLQVDSKRLLSSPYATQTQMLTNFGREQIRTECVMMRVEQWSTSGILNHYQPRRIPFWNESHTFDAIARLVDPDKPYPHFLPWERLNFVRGEDRPPVYFRQMHSAARQFQKLANRHGIQLGANFSTIDSCQSSDYQ